MQRYLSSEIILREIERYAEKAVYDKDETVVLDSESE